MNRFLTLVVVGAIGLSAITGCSTTRDPDRATSASPQQAAKGADPDRIGTSTDPDAKRSTNGADPDATKPAAPPDHDAKPSDAADQQNGSQNSVPVATSVVRFAAVPVTVTATGSVVGGANSQAALAFPESGRIAHVDVAVGQRVAAGETIAQLDTGPFAADAAQMRAALAAAQANYTKTAAGARPQLVAQTSAQIQSARTQLAAAQSNLARQQQLLHLGIASQVDV